MELIKVFITEDESIVREGAAGHCALGEVRL